MKTVCTILAVILLLGLVTLAAERILMAGYAAGQDSVLCVVGDTVRPSLGVDHD